MSSTSRPVHASTSSTGGGHDHNTRTLTSISIVHARPEHLQDIHNIQLACYRDRPDFHESLDVFRAKLEHYPAGNFVALATYSVVTDEDPETWSEPEDEHHDQDQELVDEPEAMEEEEEEVAHVSKGKSKRTTVEEVDEGKDVVMDEEEEDHPSAAGVSRKPSSTVEIVITEEGSSSPSVAQSPTTGAEKVPIVRARTPDIWTPDSDGSQDEGGSPSLKPRQKRAPRSSPLHAEITVEEGGDQASTRDEEEEDPVVSILAQWEKPIAYLFSHPFTRETATLHKIAPSAASYLSAPPAGESSPASTVQTKKARLDQGTGASTTATSTPWDASASHHKSSPSTTETEAADTRITEAISEVIEEDDLLDDIYEHDQFVEKYFIHDMAVLPEFRGQGLAYLLYKALEESLTPLRDTPSSSTLIPPTTTTTTTTTTKSGYTVRTTRRWNLHGAPNVKELHLVSVQGTRPFWENRPGFRVVTDHDLDLSVYGEGAYYMMRPFFF